MKRFWMCVAAPLIAGISSAAAKTQDYERVAEVLGNVLAFEEPCGLKYDQVAIKAFIDARVPAKEIRFTKYLQMITVNTAQEIKSMTPSEKTAYCEQTRRVALTYKFISD
jgi:hypothetical protein